MKSKFTKFRKLLCYVIISLFMFGIGGELVEADTITVNSVEWLGDYQTARYAKFNVTLNGEYRYAYCLDAPLAAPGAGNSLSSFDPGLSPETKLRMINVLLAAGYPSYNLGLSELDSFYVTQAALWYARYGSTGTYKTFTPNFHLKMKNGTGGLGKYSAAYNKLIDAADSKSVYTGRDDSKITINASNGNIMTQVDEKKLLASDSVFSVSDVKKYRVEVTEENAYIYSEDLSTNYGKSKEFSGTDKFRIAIELGESSEEGEYQASFKVTELEAPQKYDLGFFTGAWSGGFQSMTLLIPQGSTPKEISFNLKGKIETTEVSFAKIAKNGDEEKYIENAVLAVYTESGELVSKFNSETTPTKFKLGDGKYYLEEIYNPSGYALNKERVDFEVSNGKITSGGSEVNIVKISDEPAYITLKKVDTDGNSVEGATFIIYSRVPGAYICGKTDSEGYLTQESSACNNIGSEYGTRNILSSTGVYSLIDLDYSNFYSKNELYVKELEPAYGYEKNDNVYAMAGPLGDSIGWYFNTKDFAGAAGDVIKNVKDGKNVTEFQFRNYRYIDISKVDAFNDSEEVPGATLQICRKANKDVIGGACETDVENNTVYVDYWLSGTEPHRFRGIQKGVRYILEEVYQPEGYILFSGMLEFELVDEQGTVKMYNHDTGEEINNPEKLKAVMPNEPITKITISKTDAAGSQEIPGAKLKICTEEAFNSALAVTGDGNNCDPIEEWESGTTPHTVTGLSYGDYRLIETIAPAGYYSKTSSTPFTLSIDGKVKSITLTNELTKLTISKRDQITGERIAGAKLVIMDLETNEIAKDYQGNELVWETKLDQDWEIFGIPGGKKYKLIETITPDGYQEGMIIDGELVNEYVFTIGNKEGDVNINLNLEVLNTPNTGISTLNLFAIGGLMIFAGYETIKIYKRRALND